jgi:hypothetical protein
VTQASAHSSPLQKIYSLAKPLLFKADAERAHALASAAMRAATPFVSRSQIHKRAYKIIFDRKVYSPLGIAAGFDKKCTAPEYIHRLGFGFIESGSLTPKPQSGNAKPRLVRLPESEALINKMGFNNPGLEKGWRSLRARLATCPRDYLIALSLGKGKDTPVERAGDDYVSCLELLAKDVMSEYLFYVAINVSSPNTPNLRALQTGKAIRALVNDCVAVSPRPVVVKFAPDFRERQALPRLARRRARSRRSGHHYQQHEHRPLDCLSATRAQRFRRRTFRQTTRRTRAASAGADAQTHKGQSTGHLERRRILARRSETSP